MLINLLPILNIQQFYRSTSGFALVFRILHISSVFDVPPKYQVATRKICGSLCVYPVSSISDSSLGLISSTQLFLELCFSSSLVSFKEHLVIFFFSTSVIFSSILGCGSLLICFFALFIFASNANWTDDNQACNQPVFSSKPGMILRDHAILYALYLHFPKWKKLDEEKC